MSVYLLLLLLPLSHALYEDQIGKFDWRQQYLGHVDSVYLDQTPGSRRLIISTQQRVLAAVNPTSGQIYWRRLFEDFPRGTVHYLKPYAGEIVTVHGDGGIVRFWDSVGGHLNAEYFVAIHRLENADLGFYSASPSRGRLYAVSALFGVFVRVESYDFKTGEKLRSVDVPGLWMTEKSKCRFVKSNFVCIDGRTRSLYDLEVETGTVFNQIALSDLVDSTDDNLELVASGEDYFGVKCSSEEFALFRVEKKRVEHAQKLVGVSAIAFSEVSGNPVLYYLQKDDGSYLLKRSSVDGKNTEQIEKLIIPENHGDVEQLFVFQVIRKDGTPGYKTLISTEAHSLILFQQSGKVAWIREESLASITTVEMIDLPLSESQALYDKELGEEAQKDSTLSTFVRRIAMQYSQFINYIAEWSASLQSTATSTYGTTGNAASVIVESELVRDTFNTHRVIIVVTSPGKVFGIDNYSGAILWSRLIPKMSPFGESKKTFPLFIQRPSAQSPEGAQCVIVGKNKEGGTTMLFVFDPITGQGLASNNGLLTFPIRLKQAALFSHPDAKHLKPLLLLDEKDHIHVFPSTSAETVIEFARSFFLFVADPTEGSINGYALIPNNNRVITSKLYNLQFSPAIQRITNIIPKRQQERVYSQGRVMGDRSVLYKYINPNVVVVTTEGTDSTQKPFFNILLIDVVTGQVVFSTTHRRARGPLLVVHSENWIVYSYHNEKSRRNEVAVLELYEGKTQSNTTTFSSFHPPPPPMVERQAYIFPSEITTLADTITEKGITSKHILFALPSGGVLELPKALLDPRRPLIVTQEHREEGIMPYIPELPIPSENIINYNQSIFNIRGIYTAPTGLESTCLTFAYGLDLYYTKLHPSKTFDILKDDFDHLLIAAVLVGLITATYVTRQLAARKAMRQSWK